MAEWLEKISKTLKNLFENIKCAYYYFELKLELFLND